MGQQQHHQQRAAEAPCPDSQITLSGHFDVDRRLGIINSINRRCCYTQHDINNNSIVSATPYLEGPLVGA